MISIYVGTPGSGKSFHVTMKIYNLLKYGVGNVICNFPISVDQIFLTNLGYLKKRITTMFPKIQFKNYNSKPRDKGTFTYVENRDLTVKYLKQYCREHHKFKDVVIAGHIQRAVEENQTLVVVDEASMLFNCRAWNDSSRQEWCKFFALHRHYGFNFILVTQAETMLDKQIRSLIEMYVSHKNLKYYNWFAKLISFVCGGSMFISLSRWQGVKEIMSREAFRYSPRIAGIYNSYMLFEDDEQPEKADEKNGGSDNGEVSKLVSAS